MEFQFHPASGRATVRTLSLGQTGERLLITLAAATALFAASLWVTVPVVVMRLLRTEGELRVTREAWRRRSDRRRLAGRAAALKEQTLERGDFLGRIAFLYAIPGARWPRALNPQRGILSHSDPETMASGLELYLRALERGRAMLAEREASDPDLARRVPAILPLSGRLFEPSAFFGPRVSPWTSEEEFFPGVDIAAPGGSAVIAPGSGTIAFAGTLRGSLAGRLWRLGNLVVLSHGKGGATVFGHLSRVDVRHGQRVSRGDRLGTVGATGWAISPQLHYEYWRSQGGRLSPTDPLFAVLNHRLGRGPVSLEQMDATSAPGPLDSLPGLGLGPEQSETDGSRSPPASHPRRPRPRPRI